MYIIIYIYIYFGVSIFGDRFSGLDFRVIDFGGCDFRCSIFGGVFLLEFLRGRGRASMFGFPFVGFVFFVFRGSILGGGGSICRFRSLYNYMNLYFVLA